MRVRWIDIVKGIGILLVCLGHTRVGLGGPVASWITSFHMPLFFVMAGLCFDENRYASYGEYLKRKGVALLYPYFMLTAFVALAFAFLVYPVNLGCLKNMLVDVFPGQNVIGFWFIRVLIIVELTYALLARLPPRVRILSVIALGLFGFMLPQVHDLLRVNVVLVSLLYYEVGHLCRDVIRDGCSCVPPGIAWLLTFAVSCAVLWRLEWPMTQYGAGGSLQKIVLALLGTANIAAAAMAMDKAEWLARPFAWLGRHSILLLAVHPTCGQLRAIWIAQWPCIAGGLSYLLEFGMIAVMMWSLSGPLNFFMKPPRA